VYLETRGKRKKSRAVEEQSAFLNFPKRAKHFLLKEVVGLAARKKGGDIWFGGALAFGVGLARGGKGEEGEEEEEEEEEVLEVSDGAVEQSTRISLSFCLARPGNVVGQKVGTTRWR
jgi:hypothetical protein